MKMKISVFQQVLVLKNFEAGFGSILFMIVEKQKSQCKYCKQYISMNKGSTTGMAGHLKNKHHLNMNQPTLEAIIKNITAPVSYI